MKRLNWIGSAICEDAIWNTTDIHGSAVYSNIMREKDGTYSAHVSCPTTSELARYTGTDLEQTKLWVEIALCDMRGRKWTAVAENGVRLGTVKAVDERMARSKLRDAFEGKGKVKAACREAWDRNDERVVLTALLDDGEWDED